MSVNLGVIAITGAAGDVGTVIRPGLREEAARLVLIDQKPITVQGDSESAVQTDLADVTGLTAALQGAGSVVHLAAQAEEAPFDVLVEANVTGTFHLLEAARRAGVRRVVLASSNRVTGCYPIHHTVFPDEPPRPDGLYGASKVALEALGQMYADKFGLEIVALRVGSLESEPAETRHLATWLSPRDCLGFFRAALTVDKVNFVAAYAVSDNSRRFWDLTTGAELLGYRPVDNAAEYAGRFADDDPFWAGGAQGGRFAEPEFTMPYLPG